MTQKFGPKRKEMAGLRFGMLTVLDEAESKGMGARWRCRCDCGQETIAYGNCLRSGRSRSCGCQSRQKWIEPVHKLAGTPHMIAWRHMIGRCYDPSNSSYERYGARGITVCDRWLKGEGGKLGVECFYEDMGPRPTGHSLDRIDVNGPYEPGNCRWASKTLQANNRRSNKWVTAFGETFTLAELARSMKVNYGALQYHVVQQKRTPEDALRRLGVNIPEVTS